MIYSTQSTSSRTCTARPPVYTQWRFRPYWQSVRLRPLALGDRVDVPTSLKDSLSGCQSGLLRYLGEIHCSRGSWAGVELDKPCGKNDGSVGGRRYFVCGPYRGLFVRAGRCRKHHVRALSASSINGRNPFLQDDGKANRTHPCLATDSLSFDALKSQDVVLKDNIIRVANVSSRQSSSAAPSGGDRSSSHPFPTDRVTGSLASDVGEPVAAPETSTVWCTNVRRSTVPSPRRGGSPIAPAGSTLPARGVPAVRTGGTTAVDINLEDKKDVCRGSSVYHRDRTSPKGTISVKNKGCDPWQERVTEGGDGDQSSMSGDSLDSGELRPTRNGEGVQRGPSKLGRAERSPDYKSKSITAEIDLDQELDMVLADKSPTTQTTDLLVTTATPAHQRDDNIVARKVDGNRGSSLERGDADVTAVGREAIEGPGVPVGAEESMQCHRRLGAAGMGDAGFVDEKTALSRSTPLAGGMPFSHPAAYATAPAPAPVQALATAKASMNGWSSVMTKHRADIAAFAVEPVPEEAKTGCLTSAFSLDLKRCPLEESATECRGRLWSSPLDSGGIENMIFGNLRPERNSTLPHNQHQAKDRGFRRNTASSSGAPEEIVQISALVNNGNCLRPGSPGLRRRGKEVVDDNERGFVVPFIDSLEGSVNACGFGLGVPPGVMAPTEERYEITEIPDSDLFRRSQPNLAWSDVLPPIRGYVADAASCKTTVLSSACGGRVRNNSTRILMVQPEMVHMSTADAAVPMLSLLPGQDMSVRATIERLRANAEEARIASVTGSTYSQEETQVVDATLPYDTEAATGSRIGDKTDQRTHTSMRTQHVRPATSRRYMACSNLALSDNCIHYSGREARKRTRSLESSCGVGKGNGGAFPYMLQNSGQEKRRYLRQDLVNCVKSQQEEDAFHGTDMPAVRGHGTHKAPHGVAMSPDTVGLPHTSRVTTPTQASGAELLHTEESRGRCTSLTAVTLTTPILTTTKINAFEAKISGSVAPGPSCLPVIVRGVAVAGTLASPGGTVGDTSEYNDWIPAHNQHIGMSDHNAESKASPVPITHARLRSYHLVGNTSAKSSVREERDALDSCARAHPRSAPANSPEVPPMATVNPRDTLDEERCTFDKQTCKGQMQILPEQDKCSSSIGSTDHFFSERKVPHCGLDHPGSLRFCPDDIEVHGVSRDLGEDNTPKVVDSETLACEVSTCAAPPVIRAETSEEMSCTSASAVREMEARTAEQTPTGANGGALATTRHNHGYSQAELPTSSRPPSSAKFSVAVVRAVHPSASDGPPKPQPTNVGAIGVAIAEPTARDGSCVPRYERDCDTGREKTPPGMVVDPLLESFALLNSNMTLSPPPPSQLRLAVDPHPSPLLRSLLKETIWMDSVASDNTSNPVEDALLSPPRLAARRRRERRLRRQRVLGQEAKVAHNSQVVRDNSSAASRISLRPKINPAPRLAGNSATPGKKLLPEGAPRSPKPSCTNVDRPASTTDGAQRQPTTCLADSTSGDMTKSQPCEQLGHGPGEDDDGHACPVPHRRRCLPPPGPPPSPSPTRRKSALKQQNSSPRRPRCCMQHPAQDAVTGSHQQISTTATDKKSNTVSSLALLKQESPALAKRQEGQGNVLDVVPSKIVWPARAPPPPEAPRRGNLQATPKTPRTSITSTTTVRLCPFSPASPYGEGFALIGINGEISTIDSTPRRPRPVDWDRDLEYIGTCGDVGDEEIRAKCNTFVLPISTNEPRPPVGMLPPPVNSLAVPPNVAEDEGIGGEEGTEGDGNTDRHKGSSTTRQAKEIVDQASSSELSTLRVEKPTLERTQGGGSLGPGHGDGDGGGPGARDHGEGNNSKRANEPGTVDTIFDSSLKLRVGGRGEDGGVGSAATNHSNDSPDAPNEAARAVNSAVIPNRGELPPPTLYDNNERASPKLECASVVSGTKSLAHLQDASGSTGYPVMDYFEKDVRVPFEGQDFNEYFFELGRSIVREAFAPETHRSYS